MDWLSSRMIQWAGTAGMVEKILEELRIPILHKRSHQPEWRGSEPSDRSGEQTRTFQYPSEVSVVGRVTGIALIIEDQLVEIKGIAERKKPPKK